MVRLERRSERKVKSYNIIRKHLGIKPATTYLKEWQGRLAWGKGPGPDGLGKSAGLLKQARKMSKAKHHIVPKA